MDVTNASPEQFAASVRESYPFHPAIRDLYARFRQNQGFQQTRGLIRLMRIVVSRIWASERDPYLIAAHDVDLGSQETLTEINQINNTLGNAIAHDIASGGSAVAERLDANQGTGEDAQDVMRLLLIASLADVPNAIKGLAVPEIVAHLCAPGRDVSRVKNEVIARLATAAWYLHSTNDGLLHVRNVRNLIARVTSTSRAYLRDQATREVKQRLTEIFDPDEGACYQRLLPLPAIDEIDVGAERVTLIVAEPHPAGLHPDLRTLYEQHTYRNRLCFLTGQRAFDSLLESARELKAVNQIIEEMHEEGIADGDTQMQQARDQLLPRFLTRFHSAIRETFTTLYYPTRDRLATVDFLMEFRDNRYDGEEQVRDALAGKQKYTTDVAGETFRRKVEARLFTQQSMPWAEVKRRAATSPVWQWHRVDALDRLKADCLHRDLWRDEGSYVNNLKGLEVESHGDFRAGVYQEFARGFGVADYRRLLHTGKANQTRLKTASELQRADLTGAGLLRHALYAVWRAAATGDTADSMTWLRTEIRDYWPRREPLVAILRCLAGFRIDHWRTDDAAARLVAGAVENDHV